MSYKLKCFVLFLLFFFCGFTLPSIVLAGGNVVAICLVSRSSCFPGALLVTPLHDLMALPLTAQCALDGSFLSLFPPVLVPGSSRVNMFAQCPRRRKSSFFSNPCMHIFPPIILIPRVFNLLAFVYSLAVPLSFLMLDSECWLFKRSLT